MATDGTASFIVTWAEQVPKGGDIRSRLFNLEGSPLGKVTEVEGPVDTPIEENQVAMDRRGNYVIVWSEEVGKTGIPAIFGKAYAANDQPLGAAFRINAGGAIGPRWRWTTPAGSW